MKLWHLISVGALTYFGVVAAYLFQYSFSDPYSNLTGLEISLVLLMLSLLAILSYKGLSCFTTEKPYSICILLAEIAGFFLGMTQFCILLTDSLPPVKDYPGVIFYLHIAVTGIFGLHGLLRIVGRIGWAVLRACEADFDKDSSFTLTAAVLTAGATIATILQREAFKDERASFTVWTTYAAYTLSGYLYFGGQFELNPHERCYWLVRQVLALLTALAFQGFVFLGILIAMPLNEDPIPQYLFILFVLDASLIAAGFSGVLVRQLSRVRLEEYELLPDKLKRQFYPLTEGLLLQAVFCLATLAHFHPNEALQALQPPVLLALAPPFLLPLGLLPLQWWVFLPRVHGATLAPPGPLHLSRLRRSLLRLLLPYTLGILASVISIIILHIASPHQHPPFAKSALCVLYSWVATLTLKSILLRYKLHRLFHWYKQVLLMEDGFFALEPLLLVRRERRRQTRFDRLLAEKIELPKEMEDEPCPVCLAPLSALPEGSTLVQTPKCGHYFHSECLRAWGISRPCCPLDRAPLFSDSAASDNDQDYP